MHITMTAPFDINTYLLEDWLYYHSFIGVDSFVIFGVNSKKDLKDKVESLKCKYNIYFEEHAFSNGLEMVTIRNSMLSAARKLISGNKNHWVINNDSDEFIYVRGNRLKEFINNRMELDINSIYFNRYNMLPFYDNKDYISPLKSYRYLVTNPVELTLEQKNLMEKIDPLLFLLRKVNGKMLAREDVVKNIDTGSHFLDLVNKKIHIASPDEGFIVHYPYSTFKQTIEEQTLKTPQLYFNPEIEKPGWHRQVTQRLLEKKELVTFFTKIYSVIDTVTITKLKREGTIKYFDEISNIVDKGL